MYRYEDNRHSNAFTQVWNNHVKELSFRDDNERRDEFEQLVKYYGTTIAYDSANTLRAKPNKVYRNFTQKKNHIDSCRNAYNIWIM